MKNLINLCAFIAIFSSYIFPQWSDDPSLNTQVSLAYTTSAGSGGEYAKSVSDGSGGVIIVWDGTHTNEGAIFAQRLNANGNRMWGDSGIVVSDAIYPQFNPVLVSDGVGGAIIAWEDYRSGAFIDIYAQRVDSDGNLLWQTTNGVPVCTTINSYKQYLRIAGDNNNGAYIVWVEFSAPIFAESDIYAQRLDQNGNLIGPASGIPICTAPNYQFDPAIITSDVQGNAIISWIDLRVTVVNGEVYAQKINLTGNIQWLPDGIKVSNNSIDFFLENNSICSDENGGAILAWSSYGFNLTDLDIFAQKISASGTILWTPPTNEQGIPVCNELDEQYYPVITSDGSGGAIIAWADKRSSSTPSIYAQKINQNGSAVWTPQGELICDNTYSDFDDIQIVATSNGGAIICWSDNRDLSTNNLDIYAQLISQFGVTQWNYSGNVISSNTLQQGFPNIINDGFDNAILSWPDDRGYVYAQIILKNGLFFLLNNVDGIISSEEYGSHVEGENMFTSEGKTWYMNWTEDSLFIGISSFDDPDDALIVYLDTEVAFPVNFNDETNGNFIGNGEFGAIEPQLPFTSDFYVYYSPTYGSYFKKPDGNGAWDPNYYSSFNYIYNDSNQVIELAVAWSDINPVFQFNEFNWLGAICDIGAFPAETYARVPDQNPLGTFPEFTWYYTVRFNYELGFPEYPFERESFAYRYSSLTINQLDCFDFTFNSPFQTIERTSGEWNINGSMVIYDGELNFSNNDDIKIKENYVQLGGIVTLNTANVFVGGNCLYYGGTINLLPGQTFILDGFSSGILQGPFPFSNLTINKSQVLAWSDQTVNGTLTLQQGNLIMVGPPPTYTQYTLTIGPNGGIGGGGYIQGGMTIFLPPSPAPNGGDSPDNLVVNFPVGTANGPSPVSFDFSSVTSPGKLTVEAYQSIHPNTINSSETLGRYWKITKDEDLAFTSADITFNYRPEDFNGTTFSEATDEASMIVGKYNASWSYPSIFTRTPGGINDGGSITISGVTSFSDFTMFKSQLSANVKVFLEGPYLSGSMSTALNTGGSIPLSQPYYIDPWGYNGTETVASIPSGVVDWVLLELRSNPTTQVARRAAFLKSDGSLADLNGTSLVSFPGVPAGNYYLVIYHRNHIPIMTAGTVSVSETPTLYDISTGQGQAYGSNAMKDLGGGVFGLFTADTDGDGTVNATDRSNTWNQRNLSGYYGTDVDLSGTVNAADRSATWNNRNLTTQVPAPVDRPITKIVNENNN